MKVNPHRTQQYNRHKGFHDYGLIAVTDSGKYIVLESRPPGSALRTPDPSPTILSRRLGFRPGDGVTR